MALACVLGSFCSELTCHLPGHAFLTTSLNTQLPPPHIRFLLMVTKATVSRGVAGLPRTEVHVARTTPAHRHLRGLHRQMATSKIKR